ncbi:MAG TPA: hypothetical protein VEG30_04145 [Terriglobales bacterium]|nr:hypothetical protein [Terriglobales bacterium]
MKTKFAQITVLLTLVFALTAVSMAAGKNSASVNIPNTAKVGDTQLKPGDYKVEWDGTGPDVQVSFLQGKNTVATAPAKLVQQSNPYYGAIETTGNDDSSRVINAIDLKNRSLVFTQAAAPSGGQ